MKPESAMMPGPRPTGKPQMIAIRPEGLETEPCQVCGGDVNVAGKPGKFRLSGVDELSELVAAPFG